MFDDDDPFDLDDHRPRPVTEIDRELAAGCREVLVARGSARPRGEEGEPDDEGPQRARGAIRSSVDVIRDIRDRGRILGHVGALPVDESMPEDVA